MTRIATPSPKSVTPEARALDRMSHLERHLLWQVVQTSLPRPILEHRFAPPRQWRFDMAWIDLRLAVEVEGGTWMQGRHSRPAAFEADCEKYAEAAILGWFVIRVTGHMVEDGRALGLIERAIAARQAAAA